MKPRSLRDIRTLSTAIQFAGTEPPREFRIFRRGPNPSTNGPPVIFDDRAAELVMAAYREHGVALAIDLEHLSLENPERSNNFNPDAYGSFELAVRNGELWAVNVAWSDEAIARMAAKKQRYFSPAFLTEELEKAERVIRLVNIALCAQPALDHLAPLVAATERTRRPQRLFIWSPRGREPRRHRRSL